MGGWRNTLIEAGAGKMGWGCSGRERTRKKRVVPTVREGRERETSEVDEEAHQIMRKNKRSTVPDTRVDQVLRDTLVGWAKCC